MRQINDFGRRINGAKKDKFTKNKYYTKEGNIYKVYISRIWNKKTIAEIPDRYCRFLVTEIRMSLKPVLKAFNLKQAEVFIKEIRQAADLFSVEFEDYTEVFDALEKLETSDYYVDLKRPEGINHERLSPFVMEDEYFEINSKEIAHLLTSQQLWFLTPESVDFNRDLNCLEIEIPISYDVISINLNNLDFDRQDPELGFIVELLGDNREVTKLNVTESYYEAQFAKRFDQELAKLEKTKFHRNNRVKTDFSQNPGIRYGFNFLNSNEPLESDILEKFQIAGQFGNWITQSERREFLTSLYNALADLSYALGINPINIALTENDLGLGVAFGARGNSKAAAHFEPEEFTINLTRKNGKGCLAHEFGHALDYYLGKGNEFASDQPFDTLPELSAIFKYLSNPDTVLSQSSIKLDRYERRKEPYWSSLREKFARSFNSVIVAKLQRENKRNDFLCFNFNEEIIVGDKTVNANPTGSDLLELIKLFDNLINKLKDIGLFEQLNESDLFLKRDFPVRRNRKTKEQRRYSGKQIAFM